MTWVLAPLKRFADFTGRSRRIEFWVFTLLVLVGQLLASYADSAAGNPVTLGRMRSAEALFTLVAVVPFAAVSARRLHDVGRSGQWMIAGAAPYALWHATQDGTPLNSAALIVFAAAALGLLVMLVQPGSPGANQYGENPKGVAAQTVAEAEPTG